MKYKYWPERPDPARNKREMIYAFRMNYRFQNVKKKRDGQVIFLNPSTCLSNEIVFNHRREEEEREKTTNKKAKA